MRTAKTLMSWADAQADLSLCWVHTHFVAFVISRLKWVVTPNQELKLITCETMSNEPPHDKTNKMACVPIEDSDQPGHPPSLVSLRCPHEETIRP